MQKNALILAAALIAMVASLFAIPLCLLKKEVTTPLPPPTPAPARGDSADAEGDYHRLEMTTSITRGDLPLEDRPFPADQLKRLRVDWDPPQRLGDGDHR